MPSDAMLDSQEIICIALPRGPDDVDEAGYLAANPDIRANPEGARRHFIAQGRADGRLQAVHRREVAALRERKIRRLRFTAPLDPDRSAGAAANFLSDQIITEFSIPDAPPVSANPYGEPIIKLIRDNPDKLFLDVGAGLRHIYYGNVVNTEIYPSVSTDILCVGEAMPFQSNQFDFVFCFATLEHTRRPWDVAREICRVLKPGGTVIIDYPFMQPVHGYPHHYFNATPMGNQSLFEQDCDITSLEIGWHQHPIIGLQWMLTAFRDGLPTTHADYFENLRVKDIVKEPLERLLSTEWSQSLDPAIQKVIASGSMLVAVKRSATAAQSARAPASAERVYLSTPGRPSVASTSDATGLRQQVESLRRELDAVHRSTSWRLTAPLRLVKRQWLARPTRPARHATGKSGQDLAAG